MLLWPVRTSWRHLARFAAAGLFIGAALDGPGTLHLAGAAPSPTTTTSASSTLNGAADAVEPADAGTPTSTAVPETGTPTATATATPTPVCDGTQAITVTLEPSQMITLTNGTTLAYAIFANNGPCAQTVGLASYKRLSPDNPAKGIYNQQSYDAMTATLGAGQVVPLTVTVPTCAYQIDAFYGALLSGNDLDNGTYYGTRKIGYLVSSGLTYCEASNIAPDTATNTAVPPTNTTTATPTGTATGTPTNTAAPSTNTTTATPTGTATDTPTNTPPPAPTETVSPWCYFNAATQYDEPTIAQGNIQALVFATGRLNDTITATIITTSTYPSKVALFNRLDRAYKVLIGTPVPNGYQYVFTTNGLVGVAVLTFPVEANAPLGTVTVDATAAIACAPGGTEHRTFSFSVTAGTTSSSGTSQASTVPQHAQLAVVARPHPAAATPRPHALHAATHKKKVVRRVSITTARHRHVARPIRAVARSSPRSFRLR